MCVAAALLPAADEVEQQLHAPRHAALEEPEVERGEPERDAAEDECLGERVAARGEVADVVEHVARRRLPQVPQPIAGECTVTATPRSANRCQSGS